MGDKYIIELEDKPFHKEDGDFLYRVKGFNSLVFDMTGIGKLTPYTEPDLERTKKTAYYDGYNTGYQAGREDLNRVMSDMEQIRKEAYEEGYKTAKIQCGIQAEKDMREVGKRHYQRGLADAWEAAKKLALMDTETSENVTGYFGLFRIMENLTPMQAIEKIRQYEQEQEEIKVGDEVLAPFGTAVVTNIVDDRIFFCYADVHGGFDFKKDKPYKTGRHFPEIVTVLAKMRENT